MYAVVTVLVAGVYILIALGLLKSVSPVLVHGQELLFGGPIVAEKTWQLLVIGVLLAVALLACWRVRRRSCAEIKLIWLGPMALGIVFCLWLLLRVPHWGILMVWGVTAIIAFIVLLWPYVARWGFGDDEPATDAVEVKPPRHLEPV